MVDKVIVDEPLARYDESAFGANDNSVIDLRELYATIYRSRFWIAGIMALCLAAGIVATLLMTRQYEGVASVEVRQEAEKVLGTESDRETAATKVDVERFLDTQLDIVRSRYVTVAVAEELGFFRNDDFLNVMKVDPETESDGILSEQESRRELVIETLLDNLSVGYTGQTRILAIRFYSPDPRLSSRIANAYATNFIRGNLTRKAESSSYALEFLKGQLTEAQSRLGKSEQDALDYARRTRIVDASNAARTEGSQSTQPQSLVTAQLVQLNQAYSKAVAERIAAEQRWGRISGLPLLNTPEVLQNQAVQGLLEKRAVVEAEYREQLETRQEGMPEVRKVAARLTEIDRQLNAVARNIRGSLEGEFQIAQRAESKLKSTLEQLKGQTLTEQNQGIQWSILRREADTNRQQYEALLRRFNQLNAESGVQANNLAIIDRATVDPEPAWPKVPLNIGLALVAGLVLSAIYLIAQVQLFDRVRTSVDVMDRLKLPLLGAIPNVENVIEQMRDRKSAVSEASNLIRSGVSMSSSDGGPRSIMLTSVQASEGKSSTCISLAIGFARLGKRVLLVDLDLRRPNVHRLLSLNGKTGASDILSGQVSARDVIQKSAFENLDVITGGKIPPSPTELIMGTQFQSFLVDMMKVYDMVLIDSPPVLALADAQILASQVEATLFIVESGRNSLKMVQSAVSRIVANGGKMGGIVLTKYDPGKQGYGYYGDYAYEYSYGARDGGSQ